MPDPILTEEPLQLGEGGRLFGILTLPTARLDDANALPVFVFLNAGLLHRVGPFGLYVRLARSLARMGFTSLRVDLAGRGDSPARGGLGNAESVAADFNEIASFLQSYLGSSRFILAGLCSAADDAIRLAADDARILGMCMLDPFCFPDEGFEARTLINKFSDTRRYLPWLKRRLQLGGSSSDEVDNDEAESDESDNIMTLRDPPTLIQLQAALQSICARQGRVLSIFSRSAVSYYNKLGQLGRVLNVENYDQFCQEIFWSEVGHTYDLAFQRDRLVNQIETWAACFKATALEY